MAVAGVTPTTSMPSPGSSRSSEEFVRAGAAALEVTKLTAGTMVGEYVIQDQVGEGGMGTVYSAVHPIIGKKVAIKVLSGKLAKNKNAIQRFVLEARAVNDIQHPGLVDIFSFGRLTDGRHYYVMEFLEGRNLGDVLRDRDRLTMEEAIPLFIEVLRALVAVHSKGIVHRDLKPENILLLEPRKESRQRIKLVDFGLAKLMEGVPMPMGVTGPRTAAGVNVGTPHYMSPEQCRGGKVDARSDLYAFGILLYEVLTGQLLINGSNAVDIWQAHVELVPRPAHDVAPNQVTPAMGAIIAKLLAKRPEQRYQTAIEVCEALAALPEAGPSMGTPLPQFLPSDPSELENLARALEAFPDTSELVSLDEARNASREPLNRDELAATTKDLQAIMLPDEEGADQDLENLRSMLGIKIDTPIREEGSAERSQMSVLQINLESASKSNLIEPSKSNLIESRSQGRETARSVPRGAPKLPSRPVEERLYVPPLNAPSVPRQPEAKTATGSSFAHPSLTVRIIRGVVIAILLVAATIIAFKSVK